MDLSTRAVVSGLISIITLLVVTLLLVDPAGTKAIDFIERYLGNSPDGGDGSMEVMFLVVLVTMVATLSLHLSQQHTGNTNHAFTGRKNRKFR